MNAGRSAAVRAQRGSVDTRLPLIDALRGIASLGVAWFHFTHGNAHFLGEGWLKSSGEHGWAGVQAFFVVSGFVIPYALHRARYELRDFGRFVLKRIIRLDPPYLVGICMAVLLAYAGSLSPGFAGTKPTFTVSQLALHLGYLNSFTDQAWVNPVFWSLGIEFQYYLLIGLMFPLFASTRSPVRFGAVAILLLPGLFVGRHSLIFVHLPLFVLGIMAFQHRVGLLHRVSLAAGVLVAAGLTWHTTGPVAALVGLATAGGVLGGRARAGVLGWFGMISYSLYLVHVPIGGRVVNLGARFAHGQTAQVSVLAAAMLTSVCAAYVLYRLVERPSQAWSARVAYRLGRK